MEPVLHLHKLEEPLRHDDGGLGNVIWEHLDFTRSRLEKMWEPAMLFMKSRMFETGYLSGTIALLSWRKSPPSGFSTIWKAEDHGELLWQMIPAASIFSNSALAAASFCGSKH